LQRTGDERLPRGGQAGEALAQRDELLARLAAVKGIEPLLKAA